MRKFNEPDKEEFIEYYNNHSDKSTKEYFKLTNKPFKYILEKFNLKKHNKTENIKLTNLEKYGCENVFQNKEIKDKCSNTKLLRYNDINYNNPKKREETCLRVFGTPSASGDPKVREKIKNTNLERYGVDNLFKDRELMESAYINKHGSLEEHYKLSHENQVKNLLLKYGVNNICKIPGTRDNCEEKRKATCMERYNVESATLLPQCQYKQGYSANSKPNKKFKELLEQNNIEFTPEFILKNRSFDFRVNNILIEINPTATHNSTWSPFGNVKSKDYHYEKAKLARENGFINICIWDWTDKNEIIDFLKSVPIDNINIKEQNNTISAEYNNKIISSIRYNKNKIEFLNYAQPFNYKINNILLDWYINKYNPTYIEAICDLSKHDPNMFEYMGFIKINEYIGIYNIDNSEIYNCGNIIYKKENI